MKARFIRESDGHEPHDPTTPKVWQVGEIVELPDCWKICRPNSFPVKDDNGKVVIFHEPPACEPADMECYDRVVQWYASMKRPLPPEIKPPKESA